MNFRNRDAEALYDPRMPGWEQFHVLFPEGGKSLEPDNLKTIYLHDYPLPAHELFHFFGFSLELDVREIWEKNACPSVPAGLGDFPETIDLLGSYLPRHRTVMIYERLIHEACERNDWDPEGLRELVRIHEYVHALHHLGALPASRARLWEPRPANPAHPDFIQERESLFGPTTDLDMFFALRTRWFESLKTEEVEFIAQIGTAIYCTYLDDVYGPRPEGLKPLEVIFWQLMAKQPKPYKIDQLDEKYPWSKTSATFRETLRMNWESRSGQSPVWFSLFLKGLPSKDREAIGSL